MAEAPADSQSARRCPQCASTEVFTVEAETTATLGGEHDGERSADLQYDGASLCLCHACGHQASLSAFEPGREGLYTVVIAMPCDIASGTHVRVLVRSGHSQEEAVRVAQTDCAWENRVGEDNPAAVYTALAVFAGHCRALDFMA